jgi:hypothetical protein
LDNLNRIKKMNFRNSIDYGHLRVDIEYSDGRLSICGEGVDFGGQCVDEIGYAIDKDHIEKERIPDALRLMQVWGRWHLNDMRPHCEHQKKWDSKKPLEVKTYKGKETKNAMWVTQKEHPEGLLSKPCDECGYRFGSAWLYEEVPTHILEFLRELK